MARNRRNGAEGGLVPAAKAALICLLLGVSAIGYVYQKNQIVDLGREIQKGRQRLSSLRDNNSKLQQALQTMQSPTQLDKRVRDMRLELAPPLQSQIMTIVEVPASTAPRSQPQLVDPAGARIALK